MEKRAEREELKTWEVYGVVIRFGIWGYGNGGVEELEGIEKAPESGNYVGEGLKTLYAEAVTTHGSIRGERTQETYFTTIWDMGYGLPTLPLKSRSTAEISLLCHSTLEEFVICGAD